MSNVDSAIALRRWESIVKETEPVFKNIEDGTFNNRDLSSMVRILRKQSKLASMVFENELTLLSEQAKTYIPDVKKELARVGKAVSPENISKVVEEIYRELVVSNLSDIANKLKEAVSKDVIEKFQETAKSFYNDYARFYGKTPIADRAVSGNLQFVQNDDSNSILRRVYESVANVGKAIVDLPNQVSTKVSQDLLPKIVDNIPDRNIAKDVGDAGEEGFVPFPKKLNSKLGGQVDYSYWAKKGFVPWLSKRINDFLYEISHTEEEKQQEIEDFVNDLRTQKPTKDLPLNIPGLDLANKKVQDSRRSAFQEDINAVWGDKKKLSFQVFYEAFTALRHDIQNLKGTLSSVVEKAIGVYDTIVNNRYIKGIRDIASKFHDGLSKKLNKIKSMASKAGNLFNNLVTGGILAWLVYEFLLKKIDWSKVASKLLGKLFPGLLGKKGDGKGVGDRAPDDDPSNGPKQGAGVNKEGNEVYTVQDTDGTFHTVTKDKEGNITTERSDIDPRVIQSGEFKGYQVKQQGDLSEIGMEDSGTFTDYIHPETGRTLRSITFDSGVKTKTQVLEEGKEKDPNAEFRKNVHQYMNEQKKKREEEKKASEKSVAKSVPPDFKPATPKKTEEKKEEESKEKQTPFEKNKGKFKGVSMIKPGGSVKGTSAPTAAVSTPIGGSESVKVNPVKMPEIKETPIPKKDAKSQQGKQVYQYDTLNLQSTRANGNKADETLGILNGRDF